MFADLHAIRKACLNPPPGLKAVAMIDPLDLESDPAWHIVPAISELTFKPGKAAYAFEADNLTARLSDNTDIASLSGDSIAYVFRASVRGISASVEWLRAKLMNRRIHLVVTYQDDTRRFLPYIRLKASGDSGDRSAANGYAFEGLLKLSKPAPYFTGVLEVIGGSGGGGGSIPPGSSSVSDAEVVRLPVSTSAATLTQSIPEGVLLIAIWVRSTADQSVSIGLTAGGDELGGPQDLAADEAFNFAQALRTTAATDIFLSGLDGSNSVEFWYCQIGDGDIIKVVISTSEDAYEYAVPSGVLLTAVFVKGDTAQTVSIGLNPDGDELGGPQDLLGGEGHTFAQTLRTESTTSIHVSGLTGLNTIEIWYAI